VSTSARRLALIDGSALAYRSHFVFIRNPLMNSKGENTSAVYGFTNTLLKVIREEKPDRIAISFDTSKKTFRHEKYPAYKSTRAKMPDELRDAIPHIRSLVQAMNLVVVERDDIEADDVLGTLAVRAAEKGWDVTIHSGDKDFCQLVNDRIQLVRPKGGGDEERLDAGGVEAWMGVRPERIIDLLALMGDTSDNVPGVPGVGAKTAQKLLAQHGSLDGVLAHADEIKGKLGEKIRGHVDDAELSRDLVTIRTDVDLDVDLESLVPGEPDRARLLEIFRRFEFKRFIEMYEESSAPEVDVTYTLVRSLEELDALVDRLRSAEVVAFDTETTSEVPLDAELVGLSFAVSEAEAWYVPVGHAALLEGEGVNLPLDEALERLRPVLEDVDVPKVAQHAKYDASVLLNHGVTVRGVDFDTMLAAYLLDPGQPRFGLDALAEREFGHTLTSYADVVGKGRKAKKIWEVEAERVAPYACEDADYALRLRNRYQPRLVERKQRELFDEVEMPLSDVILRMERHGVLLDRELFATLSKELTGEIRRVEKEIHELAGREFNVNSPPQLRVVLFEELGLRSGRRTKTGASTDSDVLEKLRDAHPITGKILEYRQASKLLTTYVDALPKLIRDDTGRLHTSFNQTVAQTGRLSSSEPNLQNIPIRTEAGRRIREGFVAPEGWTLLSADYSQVELRVLASICQDPGLLDAFRAEVDVHRHTAATVFGVDLDDVTADMRAKAKAVNFGVMYGQGPRGLAEALRIPQKEAKAFIESYFERYAAVKLWKEETLEKARREGYVETLRGRRRYLPDIHSEHHQRRAYSERMAVNTVIQGTAADIIKIAMVAVGRRLETRKGAAAMLLTVHDELVFEAPPDEVDDLRALVEEEMSGALELRVPLVVETGTGRTWLDAH